MEIEQKEVVIVGAGQAGLAASFLLKETEISHVILERGEIGESWRSQRWDSFCLNTPNWCNSLPGKQFHPEDPDDFSHRDKLVDFLRSYAIENELPVRTKTPVTSVRRDDENSFLVETAAGTIRTSSVVFASGSMSRPKMPSLAQKLPEGIAGLTAGSYRNPGALPDGAVLVVGSGQSGCQIAEDLLAEGRTVFLCVSSVARAPRRYRGRDILAWWDEAGILDVRFDELEDKAIARAAQPQVSGTDGGHTVSLQSLRRDGAVLLGRLEDIEGNTLSIGSNLEAAIRFADERSEFFKTGIDKYIEANGIEAEPRSPDPYEPELPDLQGSEKVRRIDVRECGVRSVIWCTGFDADWSWIEVDGVLDGDGNPAHSDGISEIQGVYFLGFPWLSKRKSGIIFGVKEDAKRIVKSIVRFREEHPGSGSAMAG